MKIVEKKFGYTFNKIPNDLFLENFYKKKYFKYDKNFNYKRKNYELLYFNIESKIKVHLIEKYLNKISLKKKNILDLGCGTGLFLKYVSKYFRNKAGVDFSTNQVHKNFKRKIKFIDQNPNQHVQEKLDYDFIFLNNVLEHSPKPNVIIKNLHKNTKKNSYLIVTVPNDFSRLQEKTFAIVKKKYWIKYPEHLFYFNKKKFKRLIKGKYSIVDSIADFPIEIFLLSNKTNYISNKDVGKKCHKKRCEYIINFYRKNKIDGLYNLLKYFYNSEIGRNNTYLLKKINF